MIGVLQAAAPAAVLVGLGCLVMVLGAGYGLGSINRIGPGLLPVMLGVLLTMLGIACGLQAIGSTQRAAATAVRPVAVVGLAMLAWACLAEPLGFLPASFVLVTACAWAGRRSGVLSTLALAAGMSIAGYVVFVVYLRLPLTAFWR